MKIVSIITTFALVLCIQYGLHYDIVLFDLLYHKAILQAQKEISFIFPTLKLVWKLIRVVCIHRYISVTEVNMDFMCSSCTLLMLVTIYLKLCIGLGTEIYIIPSSNSPCPVKKCLTLSQLTTKSVLDSFEHNATLLFLPGDYTLVSVISITNFSNFSISSSNVSIFCHQYANFKFESINKLSIMGLKFFGCGNNRVTKVMDFLFENVTFVGGNKSETALEIDKAEVFITDSSFMHNTVGSLRGPIRILQGHKRQHAYVGGAIIANQSNVTIIRSGFLGNNAKIGGAIFVTQGSKIVVKNTRFIGNNAVNCSAGLCFGGVLYTDSGMNEVHNMLAQTSVVLTESEFSSNTATNGAVLTAVNCTVNIYSSQIYNNVAEMCGGVVLIRTDSTLKISNSKNCKQSGAHRQWWCCIHDGCKWFRY